MNATNEHDDGFVELVVFKWLMAGMGWRVDLTRLQRDAVYANQCVERGLASGSHWVRQRSAELRPRLARMGAQANALAH